MTLIELIDELRAASDVVGKDAPVIVNGDAFVVHVFGGRVAIFGIQNEDIRRDAKEKCGVPALDGLLEKEVAA